MQHDQIYQKKFWSENQSKEERKSNGFGRRFGRKNGLTQNFYLPLVLPKQRKFGENRCCRSGFKKI
jgi:hypothetical protein